MKIDSSGNLFHLDKLILCIIFYAMYCKSFSSDKICRIKKSTK